MIQEKIKEIRAIACEKVFINFQCSLFSHTNKILYEITVMEYRKIICQEKAMCPIKLFKKAISKTTKHYAKKNITKEIS